MADHGANQSNTPPMSTRQGQRLRLVGRADRPGKHRPRQQPATSTIHQPTDPRWVLAVRTSEAMQGAILPPQQRGRLIRLAKTFGLTAFDANMIIAMVQDQARRGHRPDQCPSASADQLSHISHPDQRRTGHHGMRHSLAWKVAWCCAALLTAELLVVYVLL